MTTIAPSSRSLSAQVEEILKREIITGVLAPGKRIDIHELAASWNVSPTPIREALKALSAQGLFTVSPRRGSFVARVDKQALREIFQLRIALEALAARLATLSVPETEARGVLERYQNAAKASGGRGEAAPAEVDDLIHNLLLTYSGNSRLIKTMEDLRDHVKWAQQTAVVREPASSVTQQLSTLALQEHICIAEAVYGRDVEGVVAAMTTHLQNTWARLEAHLG